MKKYIICFLLLQISYSQTNPEQVEQDTLVSAFFGLDNALPSILCNQLGSLLDGMPVNFRFPLDSSSLSETDFEVVDSLGNIHIPMCAVLAPANENGENRTVLLLGEFGTAVTNPPVEVRVVGDLFTIDTLSGESVCSAIINLNGITTTNVIPLSNGPSLFFAQRIDGNLNECNSGTQTIQVAWDGGITPYISGDTESDLFQYYIGYSDSSGVLIPHIPISIADIDDNDNFHQLCFSTSDEIVKISMMANTVEDPNHDPNLYSEIDVSSCSPLTSEVIWEENFDNLDNWIIEDGNGSWGWGNGELQYYKSENVEIIEIPDETGNNAVQITAKEESGVGITDQWGNPLNYTSGRINTKSKLSVKYGIIETRVLIPDIDLGGWPAVWLLGLSNLTWPRNGEIDIMEMGQRKAFRDLHDGHNGGNGLNNSTVNQIVGANAIFYADEALVPDNPTGAASISWDPDDDYCRPYYNYDNLTDRFLKYRLYWNPDSILFSVIDNDIEHFLFEDVFHVDSISDEFNHPFYFVTNFALGGNFTDAYSLGDPSSGSQISMPFPAKMLVDYIKVMKWGEYGEVNEGPPEFQVGDFGLFTDLTPTDNGLTTGLDAEIYVWEGTLTEGDIQPYEGENGIAWSTTGLGWFGAGIMSMQPINLFNFSDGHLNFSIKIPANVSFQIGIIDSWGNQSYVDFPSNQTTYGLVRNGDWGHASIPIEDIRGEFIDLRMLSYEFVILEVNGASCEFGLDNIYWSDGDEVLKVLNINVSANNFTLKDNYPNPFNPLTTISYNLPKDSFVSITIYDMLGNVVNNLVNTNQSSGYKSVQWNATDNLGQPISAGVYLYSIETKNFRQTKKMILLK